MRRIHARFIPVIAFSVGLVLGCGGTEKKDQTTDEQEVLTPLCSSSNFSIKKDDVYKRLVVESYLDGTDGMPLRVKCYIPKKTKAYVLFLNGRSEFIEKFDVLFTSLHEYPEGAVPAEQTLADMPITFCTMDFAGQGKSNIEGRIPGHIDHFDHFVDDVHLMITTIIGDYNPRKPVIMFSHSMGGLVAARYLEKYPGLVDAAVYSSPMFAFAAPPGVDPADLRAIVQAYSAPAPYGFGLAEHCAVSPYYTPTELGTIAQCLSGQIPGCAECFADPTQPQCAYYPIDWARLHEVWALLNSPDTIGCPKPADPAAVCDMSSPYFNAQTTDYGYCVYTEGHPLQIGGPTFGWVNEAFNASDALNASLSALNDIPTLILSSNTDYTVVASEHDRICGLLNNCTLQKFSPPSTAELYFHGLLFETYRANVIASVRNFLNGYIQ